MSWLPKDVVLFHIGDQPWMLSATVAVVGLVLTIVWGVLIATVIAPRSGDSQRLSGAEAGEHFMGSDTTALATYGAIGKEWNFSFSISDMREAWQAGNYAKFFGLPAFHAAGICSITSPFFAAAIYSRAEIIVWIVGSFVGLMFASYVFGMWAALFTKLR